MYKKQILFFSSVLVLFSAFFFGCNKQSNIGLGIVPDNYKIETVVIDTLPITAQTIKVDAIISSHSETASYNGYYSTKDTVGISKFVLGNYIDPIFGEVNASFVTEMLRGYKPAFTATSTLDSIVLQLFFSKNDSTAVVYGNANTVNQINVSQIHYNLSPTEPYYSNTDKDTLFPDLIGSATFNPSDFQPNEKYDSVLTVRLNDAVGNAIISDTSVWENERFTNYFNGLLITASSTAYNGAISVFDIADTRTRVALYYKNSSEDDSLSYIFNIDGTCARFNIFNHNYSAGNIITDFNNPGNAEDSVLYVQGGGGLRVSIKIPSLNQIGQSGIWAVNKADLVLPEEDVEITGTITYPIPFYLQLRPYDKNGNLDILEEYVGQSLTGVSAIDGKYTFDITYWVQQVVMNQVENNGLVLLTGSENTTPAGAILKSPTHSGGMKLILTLTKIAD